MEQDVTIKQQDPIGSALRTSFRNEVKSLSVLRPVITVGQILFDWTLILGSIAFASQSDSILVSVLAFFIIASRQHALLGILHEGVHYRLFNSKLLNDSVGNFLAAFPLFWDLHAYRENHFQHHKYLNTDQDPDYKRKNKHEEWQFPNSKFYLAKLFVRYLWGFGILENYRFFLVMSGHFPLNEKIKQPAQIKKIITKIVYYGAILYTLHHFGQLANFGVYWFVPYFFLYPLFQKYRSIAEHFALPFEGELSATRNVITHPAESFFFGPHNLNYHLDHHLFPTVPAYNLKKLNKALMTNPNYKKHAFQNSSYILPSNHSVLSNLLDRPKASISKAA